MYVWPFKLVRNGDGEISLLMLREHLRARGYSEASCDGVFFGHFFGALALRGRADEGAVSIRLGTNSRTIARFENYRSC